MAETIETPEAIETSETIETSTSTESESKPPKLTEEMVKDLEMILKLSQVLGDQQAKEVFQKFSELHPAEFAHWLAKHPELSDQLNKLLFPQDGQN